MKWSRYSKIAAILIAAIGLTSPVLAVGPESSETNISFTEFTGITDPKNPENPGEGSGESGTGQNGPLSLDYVPDIAFGSHTVSSTLQIYNTTAAQPYIQITDLRGTGAGWRVSAALSSFKTGGVASLNGASLLLKNANATSSYATTAPVPANPVTLTSDGTPADVVSASNAGGGQGRGTWLVRWYPVGGGADVQLSVPAASASVGTHAATITWTLYDAP